MDELVAGLIDFQRPLAFVLIPRLTVPVQRYPNSCGRPHFNRVEVPGVEAQPAVRLHPGEPGLT